MGTFPKRCPLTTAQIVEMYLGGEGLGMLSLRCRRSTAWVRDVLGEAGVPIRTAKETKALTYAERKRPTRRRAYPQPAGSVNPWGQP